MPQSRVASGSALAVKYYSVGLFTEAVRRRTFGRALTGPVPKQSAADAKARRRSMQSTHDMPIVQITDLSKAMGEAVSIDLFGLMTGEPIMGDTKAAGTGQPLHMSSMDILINQSRKVADPGGRMSRRRTVHDLRSISRANLADFFARLEDQRCLVHFCGARGTSSGVDWCIPLEASPNFSAIMVNEVKPPTRNRRFLAGGATSVTDLSATDVLSLIEIDKWRASLNEMELPPSPVKIPGDAMSMDNPLYLWFVTSRQWHYLEITSSARNNDWRSFLASAQKRAAFSKHPLFMGAMDGMVGIWNGVVIIQTNRAIRWNAGDTVREVQANGSVSNSACAVATDRSFILGGQALGECLGDAGGGDPYPMDWEEEETDGKNALEIFGISVGGKAKVQFTGTDGTVTDFGVMVFDSYAPAPDSMAGANLRSSLRG